MSLDQIDKFCSQVEAFVNKGGKRIQKVTLVGGEPLIHPKIVEIRKMLWKRLMAKRNRKFHRYVRSMWLVTNGDLIGQVPVEALEKVFVKVCSTYKRHFCSRIAPIDTGQTRGKCEVPIGCGCVLNAWGYWPCGQGGAIARLFGLKQYHRDTLPDTIEDFGDISELCDLCQMSARPRYVYGVNDHSPSASYVHAMEAFEKNPPTFDRF